MGRLDDIDLKVNPEPRAGPGEKAQIPSPTGWGEIPT